MERPPALISPDGTVIRCCAFDIDTFAPCMRKARMYRNGEYMCIGHFAVSHPIFGYSYRMRLKETPYRNYRYTSTFRNEVYKFSLLLKDKRRERLHNQLNLRLSMSHYLPQEIISIISLFL